MIYYIPPGLFVSVFMCTQAIESVNIWKLNGLQIGLIPASGVFMSYFMAAVTYIRASLSLSNHSPSQSSTSSSSLLVPIPSTLMRYDLMSFCLNLDGGLDCCCLSFPFCAAAWHRRCCMLALIGHQKPQDTHCLHRSTWTQYTSTIVYL
jgi:hypothetical protein